MSRPYQPTAEDIAKAEQRRIKREQAKKTAPPAVEDDKGQILPREWLDVSPHLASSEGHTIRIMTWNVSNVTGYSVDATNTNYGHSCWLRASFVSALIVNP